MAGFTAQCLYGTLSCTLYKNFGFRLWHRKLLFRFGCALLHLSCCFYQGIIKYVYYFPAFMCSTAFENSLKRANGMHKCTSDRGRNAKMRHLFKGAILFKFSSLRDFKKIFHLAILFSSCVFRPHRCAQQKKFRLDVDTAERNFVGVFYFLLSLLCNFVFYYDIWRSRRRAGKRSRQRM